jgi:hypothetical protein
MLIERERVPNPIAPLAPQISVLSHDDSRACSLVDSDRPCGDGRMVPDHENVIGGGGMPMRLLVDRIAASLKPRGEGVKPE